MQGNEKTKHDKCDKKQQQHIKTKGSYTIPSMEEERGGEELYILSTDWRS